MKVHHYSVGRSGCTFISQLLANIFGLENLDSGHSGYKVDDDLPVVITLRDFRDVVLSFWRVHNDISLKDLELGKRASFEVNLCHTVLLQACYHPKPLKILLYFDAAALGRFVSFAG